MIGNGSYGHFSIGHRTTKGGSSRIVEFAPVTRQLTIHEKYSGSVQAEGTRASPAGAGVGRCLNLFYIPINLRVYWYVHSRPWDTVILATFD